jgi:hypothetical protein
VGRSQLLLQRGVWQLVVTSGFMREVVRLLVGIRSYERVQGMREVDYCVFTPSLELSNFPSKERDV